MSQGNRGDAIGLHGIQFELRSERNEGSEHIRVAGEMDLAVTGLVDREMQRAEATDAEKIVLDLHKLEFMDASGVRLLLDVTARSRDNGHRLQIRRSASDQVQRVLDLTGVGEMLPFAA
jgi:anti-sigma B factor antagonist